VTGDLFRVRCAEVWVNSENTAMRMARVDEFSVSAVIRYQGAQRDGAGQMINDPIADELTQATAGRHQVPAGTAIVTGAGELWRNGVHYIARVASVEGEPGVGFRRVRVLAQCVTNALTEIGPLPVPTILFPLLGTGQGRGRLRQTAHTLVGEALDYFAAVSTTDIAAIFFLEHRDVELDACQAACLQHRLVQVSDNAVVSLPATGSASSPMELGRTLRLGLVVDVVGFGRRAAPEQEAVQERLSTLARQVLCDAGIELATVDHQWTGDGFAVFLPSAIDPPQVLSVLLRTIRQRLAGDNRTAGHRIRLRMALGIGLVSATATGYTGSMIVDINRLVDSTPLRDAVRDHPHSDLVVLMSEQVHVSLVRPGYLRPPGAEFRQVDVAVKEFHEPAWLWIAPPSDYPDTEPG
jgi:O-acetyl-ADP-ribose deacetylase (regulator of RNase III)